MITRLDKDGNPTIAKCIYDDTNCYPGRCLDPYCNFNLKNELGITAKREEHKDEIAL